MAIFTLARYGGVESFDVSFSRTAMPPAPPVLHRDENSYKSYIAVYSVSPPAKIGSAEGTLERWRVQRAAIVP